MAQFGNIYTDANGTEYTKHPVARVSKVKDDAHIYDLVDAANAIDQGANLVPGDHVDGDLQLRAAKTPAIGNKIVFVCDVPLNYRDYTKLDQAEWQFVNKKGKRTKAYEVGKDDVLGVSDYAFTTTVTEKTTPAIGNYVVVDGARAWKELVNTTAETTLKTYGFLAKVIGYEKYQFDTVVLFEVIRNEDVTTA